MRRVPSSRLLLSIVAASLSACGTSIYSLRVPLDAKAIEAPPSHPAVSLEDLRPAAERKTHVAGGLWSCQRWYGDETYQPSKVDYLVHLLAIRLPPDAQARLTLRRFDTIEYCDDYSDRAAASAVGMSRAPAPERDFVRISIAGEINARPFEITNKFIYGGLPYPFPQMPASNPVYVERLRAAFAEAADAIVAVAFPAKSSEAAK
jgi:hypothetical protein